MLFAIINCYIFVFRCALYPVDFVIHNAGITLYFSESNFGERNCL